MVHSPDCWAHDKFKEILGKVANTEIYYRAIDYYVAEHPLLLNDLLMELSQKLDHARVVNIVRSHNVLPLIKKYLLHVQQTNLPPVNEAVNNLCLQEEDYKALRESVDLHNNFDMISLAQRIENHELVEFRRIAAYLYKLNKRWDKSIELSKKDNLWADAMETAAESKDVDSAEKLLRHFVDNDQKECFAAALFTCYELIRPDVVLELAWRFNLMDFAMPFMIQCFREYDDKIKDVNKKLEDNEKKALQSEEAKKKEAESKGDAAAFGFNPMVPLAIMPPSGIVPHGMAPVGYPPQYPPPNPYGGY